MMVKQLYNFKTSAGEQISETAILKSELQQQLGNVFDESVAEELLVGIMPGQGNYFDYLFAIKERTQNLNRNIFKTESCNRIIECVVTIADNYLKLGLEVDTEFEGCDMQINLNS